MRTLKMGLRPLVYFALWACMFLGAGSAFAQAVCKPGSYNLANGREPCVKCAAGTYVGFEMAGACQFAQPGYWVPKQGATEQIACPIGTFSEGVKSRSCSVCPPGKTTKSVASIYCSATCPGNTYWSNGQCLRCPGPSRTPQGTGVNNVSECIAGCPTNQYWNGSSCQRCPSGTYSLPGGADAGTCKPADNDEARWGLAHGKCPNGANEKSPNGVTRCVCKDGLNWRNQKEKCS